MEPIDGLAKLLRGLRATHGPEGFAQQVSERAEQKLVARQQIDEFHGCAHLRIPQLVGLQLSLGGLLLLRLQLSPRVPYPADGRYVGRDEPGDASDFPLQRIQFQADSGRRFCGLEVPIPQVMVAANGLERPHQDVGAQLPHAGPQFLLALDALLSPKYGQRDEDGGDTAEDRPEGLDHDQVLACQCDKQSTATAVLPFERRPVTGRKTMPTVPQPPRPAIAESSTAESTNVQTVMDQLKAGTLVIPDYQRDADQWDDEAKSLLIESVINNLTMPAFFFEVDVKEGIEVDSVVDGRSA